MKTVHRDTQENKYTHQETGLAKLGTHENSSAERQCTRVGNRDRCKGKMYPYTSLGPYRLQPRVLRKLADVLARLLSIIFGTSWRFGQVPGDWKKEKPKGQPKDLQAHQLYFVPWENHEVVLAGVNHA